MADRDHVLVIDDDEDFLSLTDFKLRNMGYTNIFLASNGVVALEIIQKDAKKIGLILCDCMMPELDGLTLKEKMNELLPDFNAPMVVVSGYGTETLRDLATSLGVTRWLEKPMEEGVLRRVMNEFLPR